METFCCLFILLAGLALLLLSQAVNKSENSGSSLPQPPKSTSNFNEPTYSSDCQTIDGHEVRSKSEAKIDNWLYNNRIVHSYERRLPGQYHKEDKYRYKCDFYLPDGDVYIEYWGLNRKEYLENKQKKKKMYKKQNLNLVSLEPDDLYNNDMDTVLKHKLRKYMKIDENM